MPRLRAGVAILVTAAAVAAVAAASPPATAVPLLPTPKLLMIGIDGLRPDSMVAAAAPSLDALRAGGVYGESLLYAPPMSATLSGPGWATYATGVWPDKHAITSNSLGGHRLGQYPDVLSRLEAARPALNTYAAAAWGPLVTTASGGPVWSAAIDTRYFSDGGLLNYRSADAAVAANAERALATPGIDAAHVYFGEADSVAHLSGAGTSYRQAIERIDTHVGRLMAALRARPSYPAENWLVLVGTDHGHVSTGGHGGSSIDERRVFLIASGGGLPAGQVRTDTRQTDHAATVLTHFGVPIDPSWGLDGTPLQAPRTDAFDAVRPALQPRADETSIPASVLGWTRSTPAGWRIETSAATGTAGTTEWRGWALTTDEFWSRTHRDQWRELFVRGRGVFAVADPDEWDDTGWPYLSGRRFDSTLISPAFDVSGWSNAALQFTHLYRHGGTQRAEVLVSFDGGPPLAVLRFTADRISVAERLMLALPAGAQRMQVRLRLSEAGNDWFWAVDDLRVTRA